MNIKEPQWWEEPDQLSDGDLRMLVQAACSVLARQGDGEAPPDLEEMPRTMVVSELRAAVEQEGITLDQQDAERLARGDLARDAAVDVVRELARDPDLRTTIDEAYRASRQLMVADPGTLAIAALLIIAVKIHRVHVGRGTVDIQFDPIKSDMLARIGSLIGMGRA